jgi:hypothetical protein
LVVGIEELQWLSGRYTICVDDVADGMGYEQFIVSDKVSPGLDIV